jgi:hypothetical protein
MSFDTPRHARPGSRRRLVFVIVALITVALWLLLGWLLLTQHQPGQTRPGGRVPQPLASATVAASAPSGAPAVAVPPDVRWAVVAGVSLPQAASTGPADTSGGRARGFAHTQAGAWVAALHLLVLTAPQVGPEVFGPTIAEQVVGADAARMANNVEADYRQLCDAAQVPYGRPVGNLTATLRGVRIDSYRDTDADLAVLTSDVDSTGAPVLAVATVHMQWSGGDWKLVAPLGGTWTGSVRAATPSEAATFGDLTPPGGG